MSIIIVISLISICTYYIIHTNKKLNKTFVTTSENLYYNNLPPSFNNYKILQISDLHSAEFERNNSQLLKEINRINPNIIMFTGDMFNFYDITDKNIDETSLPAYKLIENLSKSYTIIYVTGNHEEEADIIYHGYNYVDRKDNDAYNRFIYKLENLGITFLDDSFIDISNGDDTISIYGINYYTSKNLNTNHYLDNLKVNSNNFNILLSHDPKYFEKYEQVCFDLILSGHVHGGIIRLPFLGGLLSPDKELFPKYDKGIFQYNNSFMNISGGLGGNSSFKGIPFIRINNQPEINLITLKLKKQVV